MSAGTIDVRARIAIDGATVADRTFTVDAADTETPWMDVLAGLIDIGRAARDTHRRETAATLTMGDDE